MTVRDICTELLPDLDEDIFEYIVGALEEADLNDDDSVEETSTMVSSFLQSADYIEEEEEALAKANEVIDKIKGGTDNANVSKKPNNDEPQKLSEETKKLTLSLDDVAVVEEDDDPRQRTTNNTLIGDQQVKQNKKKSNATNKNKPSQHQIAEQQSKEVEEELYAARIAAVKSRTELGAYKGSLDATSFTLPNPGGGQPLLEDAACRFSWGRRYGLIGRNGMGKSTMLKAIAARRVGNIPKQVTVHYVSQEVNLTPIQASKTPVECVVDADLERTLLLDELKTLNELADNGELDTKGSQRHGEVLERLEEIGAHSADRRAISLLDNLGFSKELQSRPLTQLSGGWRVRTMLAAAIFAKPDLLLLDEPTNHLSILAVMWLARELSTSETWKQRIVVIVSHDRHFMDEVCTDCLHISGAARRLTQVKGNYSLWAKRRKEEQALFFKEQAKRQAEIESLREYAGHGFKYGGSGSQINKMSMKAKQADKLELIQKEHAEELAALKEDMELSMKIAAGGELDGYVVQLLDVGFGYPNGPRLFSNCEFGITSKSRIVLLGENGNGVSSLCCTLFVFKISQISLTLYYAAMFCCHSIQRHR